MKILVETTGSFQLLDPDLGQLIRHEGYTLVQGTHFISSRVSLSQVQIKGQVNDQATDEEWGKYVRDSDGDLDLALEAFLSAFPVDGEGAPEKPSTKKSAAAKK